MPWQSDLDVIQTHWGTPDQTASVLDGQYTLVFYQVAFESTDPTLLTFMLDSRDELVAGVLAAEVQDRVHLPEIREEWVRVITSSWGESAGGCSNDACNINLPRGSEFDWIPFCQDRCEEPEAQLMITSSEDRAEMASSLRPWAKPIDLRATSCRRTAPAVRLLPETACEVPVSAGSAPVHPNTR